jgi:hypothetical protein
VAKLYCRKLLSECFILKDKNFPQVLFVITLKYQLC